MRTSEKKREVRRKLQEALGLRDQGNLERAASDLQDLAHEYQNSEKFHLILGGVLWDLERHEEACSHFRMATLLAPVSDNASLSLFHVLWDIGHYSEALAEMDRFLSISNSDDYLEILRELNEKWGDETDQVSVKISTLLARQSEAPSSKQPELSGGEGIQKKELR